MIKNYLLRFNVAPSFRAIFVFSLFTFILAGCSHTVLINSSTKNPPGNDTPLDKKDGIILSVSKDNKGILINIRVPDAFDQYKVLKYGALLSVKTDKSKQIYSVAYPLENTNKKLRLPIVKKEDSSFHIDNLLSALASEANQLAAFQFYGKKNFTGNSAVQDSLAAQAVKEPIGASGLSKSSVSELVYSVFIPYNSIPDFAKSNNGVNKIKIHFQSAYLNIIGGKGLSSTSGPYYGGYAGYFGPYYRAWGGNWGYGGYGGNYGRYGGGYGRYGGGFSYGAGAYWGGSICRPWLGYVATNYSPYSERYKRKHPNTPVPDTKVLEKLTVPIDVEAKIQLAR